MTAHSTTPLVELVAVAMWNTWNRVMVEYGLHKQSNGGFYDPEPTDDSIKAEAHRLLRKAALDEAQAALDVCEAEAMRKSLGKLLPMAQAFFMQHPTQWNQNAVADAIKLIARLDGKPTEVKS